MGHREGALEQSAPTLPNKTPKLGVPLHRPQPAGEAASLNSSRMTPYC
jgi:hypothetical protein